ncbi:hypothetical protein AAES_154352 [Amazona aestiva]|uniref:Uncharacterized protein n=1 Tax=Amazona aestiva TaxID=12930 RepID=A0A0Q3T247_AMAAE|nr:hypothetical protein AAES_154352 [Amazona aestiva]
MLETRPFSLAQRKPEKSVDGFIQVITDGALDKTALTDDVGSEEDLYEDFRSSNHRYGHPGGGGEQLAINEGLGVTIHSAKAFVLKIVLGMSMPQFSSSSNTCDGEQHNKQYEDLQREGDKEGMCQSRNAG